MSISALSAAHPEQPCGGDADWDQGFSLAIFFQIRWRVPAVVSGLLSERRQGVDEKRHQTLKLRLHRLRSSTNPSAMSPDAAEGFSCADRAARPRRC
jgi:hypothetical protein